MFAYIQDFTRRDWIEVGVGALVFGAFLTVAGAVVSVVGLLAGAAP